MKPGIYTDVSFEQYSQVQAFSNSWAGYLEECPSILKHNMRFSTRKDTPALIMGRAVHEAVFEPRKFGSGQTFIESRKYGQTNAEKAAKAEFIAQHPGKTIMNEDDYSEATEIAASVLRTKTGSSLIKGAQSEVSIFWACPDTGVLCKGRIDGWNKQQGVVIDLKTTSDSLREDSLQRVIAARRYHRQLAWYSYGLDLLGEAPELQIIIFVQKRAPYPVAFKALSFGSIIQGKREMRELVKLYAKCLETNDWPGFPDSVSTIELPVWAQKDGPITDNTIQFYTEEVHEEMMSEQQDNA